MSEQHPQGDQQGNPTAAMVKMSFFIIIFTSLNFGKV